MSHLIRIYTVCKGMSFGPQGERINTRGETYIISNSEKDYRFLRKPLSCFYYYFCCLDENKNKLSICKKDESSYICRFDELPYYHRSEHSSILHVF